MDLDRRTLMKLMSVGALSPIGVAEAQDSDPTSDTSEGTKELQKQTCIYQRPEEERSEIDAPANCNLQLVDPARGNTYYSPFGIEGWHESDGLEVANGRLRLAERDSVPAYGDIQYLIDEGSGTTLNDRLGNTTPTSPATIAGATWVSDSNSTGGYYLDLAGGNDYISTDNDIPARQSKITVFGWFRPRDYTSFDNSFAASGQNPGGGDGWIVDTEDTDGEILTLQSGSSNIRNANFVAPDNWGFLAVQFDDDDCRLIAWDTSQEIEDTGFVTGSARTIQDDQLYYGVRNEGAAGYYDGDIDFVGFSDSLLSKTKLEELWQQTNNR